MLQQRITFDRFARFASNPDGHDTFSNVSPNFFFTRRLTLANVDSGVVADIK